MIKKINIKIILEVFQTPIKCFYFVMKCAKSFARMISFKFHYKPKRQVVLFYSIVLLADIYWALMMCKAQN